MAGSHSGRRSAFSAKLVLSQEYVDLLLIGKASKPRFSSSFPAKHIETALGWNDLVLSEDAMRQVQELQSWLQHKKTLMKGLKMDKKLKQGYRVLFTALLVPAKRLRLHCWENTRTGMYTG
ncbi:hypothetical protein LWM68_44290 [Niabella sp. W65]|nr:hypothetical protein [Niabella sp. W65]MCH7369137.1 hypothetical protein [Niabella sp. W65]ULT44693.1 hypothetical protein KRR40_16010 [Niabella sp. I65]